MSNSRKNTTPTEKSVPFNTRTMGKTSDSATVFKDADKIPGSKLPHGTDLYIFHNPAECGDGPFIEFANRKTHKGEYLASLSCNDPVIGTHKNFHTSLENDTVASQSKPSHYKGHEQFNEGISAAIAQALDRAKGDGMLTTTEVLQFEKARALIEKATISNGDMTADEQKNIISHLNKIAPNQKQSPSR